MSRDTIHLAQEQIRHEREITTATRNRSVLVRTGPCPTRRLFELYLSDGALRVWYGTWFRNNIDCDWADGTPTWNGGSPPPATGDFAVWAQLDHATSPTTLVCYYDASSYYNYDRTEVLPFPFPTADSCWRALGSFNIATGGVISITAQYHLGIIQDWA